MNDRYKYPINGVCRFENFAERAANDTFPEIPIGSLAGVDDWFMSWYVVDGAMIYPYIESYRRDNIERYRLTYHFQVINKESERSSGTVYTGVLNPGRVTPSDRKKLLDILNLEEGWIDEHGTVTVEYGVLCESIQGKDSVWRFNFFDRDVQKEERNEMVTFANESSHLERQSMLHCSKQVLKHHLPQFQIESTGNQFIFTSALHLNSLDVCLQIAHGVRLPLNVSQDFFRILFLAHKLQLTNVVRYCERQMIENGSDLFVCLIFHVDNCNHYFALLLKQRSFWKELKFYLATNDEAMERLPGTYIKMLIAKFLHGTL